MIDNSYYIILNRLKAFANGHKLINTFTYHEIANFDITKNPHYPIMHAVPLSMNPSKGAIDYSFEITFADWVRAKEEKQENEVTVISDLHRCALDLCAEITNGNILFGDEVTIQGDAIITPFIDEFANTLSGVTLQITIRIPYDWSACDIPANWVDGTGDIPDFGGRSLTMDIYDEGNFVVAAREMNFVGSGVTVTYTGNRAIVTINGGSGGGAVDSVNGQTGVVVLDASDVGADAAGSAASALASANSYTDSEIAALTAADVGLGNVDNTSDLDKPISTATQAALDLKVESVMGDSVDNTDPLNPVVNAIPLAGTVSGSPVTGSIEENIALAALFNDWMYQGNSSIGVDDEGNLYIKEGTEVDGYAMFRVSNGIGAESRYTNSAGETTNVIVREDSVATKSKYAGFVGQVYDADYSVNFTLRSLIDQEVMKSRIWTKAGTPTTSDDSTEGYVVGSLIWDTTNDQFYTCTDNTATAAVWVNAISIGLSKNNFANIVQDFMAVGTGSYNELLTTASLTGTQGTAVGQVNHPGIVSLLDSAIANGGFAITTNNNMLVLGGGEKATFIFQDRNTTTRATAFIRMGFIDSVTSVLPTDGAFVQIQGGVMKGYCRNNNTQTATGTTIAITQNTWYSVTVEVVSTSLVTFTLYSEAGAVLWTDNVTTNIPSTTGRETGFGASVYESTTSAAAEILWLDYMSLEINRSLVR